MAEWKRLEVRGNQTGQLYLYNYMVHSIGNCYIGKLETLFTIGI